MTGVRSRLAALAIVATVASLAAGGALGCGPSFQSIYEGDVRFEHCYAVDESQRAPGSEKLACWHDWLRTYTYGQTADRVEYAAARYHLLKTGDAPFALDALADGPTERPTARQTIGGPEPTSAFAPPPNVAPPPPASTQRSEPMSVAARPPGSECGDDCSRSWRECRQSCKDGECSRCDASSRSCMSACFVDEKPAPPRRR
jgi:hypothetical protein